MTFLASLNPQQREAVTHTEGPLLLLAGAGSGKTRVVVSRIAYLILEKGVAPESILGVTFTNKAAGEMRERVRCLLDEHGLSGGAMPSVSTFHSFCVRLLRRFGAPLAELRPGFATNFLVFDESDQAAVVKAACREIGSDAEGIKPKTVLGAISRAKNQNRPGTELHGKDQAESVVLNRIYQSYRKALLEANALDFDDLLLEAACLLESFDDIREALQARYRYLLVDEFQDTNRPQYEIMRLLSGRRPNVCVVGDEDQAIYSWRGADIGNILGFELDFPSAQVIRLEQNYRSTRSILKAATAVVERNKKRKGKRLWTDGPEGDRPVVFRASDGYAEARYVTREIGRLLDEDPEMRVGVLYRTNAQSRLFEEVLRQEGRDFLLVGGVAFYQRAEVKDLLAYLRVAVSPDDAVSLRRIVNVPARGIGKSTLERLHELASSEAISLRRAIEEAVDRGLLAARARTALDRFRQLMAELREQVRTDDLDSVLEWVFERTGYRNMLESDESAESRSRVENVKELIVAAREAVERGDSVEEFLDHAALVADSDGIDQAAPILLMTLHNAKGLEFPAVAMVGMEETLLPHARSLDAGEDAIEEERRLCYVGMTRARRHLWLTCAESRRQYGGGSAEPMLPSRFLGEIPEELVDDRSTSLPRDQSSHMFRTAGRWSDDTEPAPLARRSGLVATAGIETHDSVSAVAGFFKDRGIAVDLPARNSPPAAVRPPLRARRLPKSPSRHAPKLGQALKELRRQGPFARGTRVRHQKFGIGVVERREGEGPNAKLSVYFKNYGLKKLVAGYANLREV